MSDTTISVSPQQLAGLAVEHWRLATALGESTSAPVKYALRKIEEFLKSCAMETRVLDGQPYDAGLAARVIDTIDDRALKDKQVIVAQTLSPMILHGGNVVRSAEIVIARNPG